MSDATDTSCKQCIDLLLEYVDGVLPVDVRSRLEAHMGGCTPCEEFLKSYRATPGLCRKALAAELPREIAKKLTDFLKRELAKP